MLKIMPVTAIAKRVIAIKKIRATVLPVIRVNLISMEDVFPVAVNQ